MYAEVPDVFRLKMWEDYQKGDKLLATRSHRTADRTELPFFKGEMLTFVEQHGNNYCNATNSRGDSGLIPLSHVVYKEVFHDRNWFQTVCTRTMAESCLDKEAVGTFLVRFGHADDQFAISAKSEDGIMHERFYRKGSKYLFRSSEYNSVDDITKEVLKDGYKPLDFTLPETKENEHHTENTWGQILTGGLAIAKRNFRHREKDLKFLTLRKNQKYRIIGISSNLNWYIMKDEVKGTEGFAPACLLPNITPGWYHGEKTIAYADNVLSQQIRNYTFLVTHDNFLYTLSARSGTGHLQVDIEYKNENVTCFNSTGRSITELVNYLTCLPTEPIIRHPIPNTHSETLDLDSVELYLNALHEGIEHDYNIRIMLIGHYGAGKSTLANRLLNKHTDTTESTDGIEIHVMEACFDVENGKWSQYTTQKDEDRLEQRLENVIRRQSASQDAAHTPTRSATVPNMHTHTGHHPTQTTPVTGSGKLHVRSANETDGQQPGNKIKFRTSASDLTQKQRDSISQIVKRSSGDVQALSPISVWDFAGQFIFYATHQVFMSSRALYILVLDLSKPLDSIVEETDQPSMCSNKNKRTVRSFIELWMKSIHMTNDGENSDLPAVLMIGTHEDKLPVDETDRKQHIENYFESVRRLFDDTPLLKHIQPEQFWLDARKGDEVVNDIQQAVYDICHRLPWWGEEKPARWINLEQILIKLQQTNEIVDIAKILDENRESQMPVASEEEVRLFLRTQHNAGNLIYFEKDELEDTVVLQPQWIVNAFKSLITSEQFCMRNTKLRKPLNDLFLKGVLTNAFIIDLWSTNAASKSFLEHMDTILLYMENLNIIAKMKTYEEGELFYFVPSLLPQAELDIAAITSEENRSAVLAFIVSHELWHPPLFNVVEAALIGRWNVLKIGNEVKLTSTSGVFELDRSKTNLLVVTTLSNTINCYVTDLSGSPIDSRKCDEIRRFITATLAKQIRANVNEVVELAIRCDQPNKIEGSDDLFKCDLLTEESNVCCFAHHTSHIIDTRKALLDWFPDGYTTEEEKSCLNNWIQHSTEYVNDRPLIDKDLQQLSLALGMGWEHIGHSLGVSDVIIDHCKMDHPHKTEMQIYTMLKKWKVQESRNGPITFLRYVRALIDNSAVKIDWDRVKNVWEGI